MTVDDRSVLDDVDREALHDWVTQLDQLRADARPDPSEYADLERSDR